MENFTLPYKFYPRWYQLSFMKALDSGIKRAVCCFHRGAGKDLMAMNYLIKKAFEEPGVYLHCFPNYSQGKKAIWTSVHNNPDGESLGYLDHIPEHLIKSKNSSEMMIQFVNGSIYCIMGLDGKNAQRARGMNPRFVILSEYAYMAPEAWHTIEPRISQNKGTAIFLSTPNGKNHFYDLYNQARSNPDKYFSNILSIEDTKILPQEHIENLRKEGVPEDFIQQEYFCSFTRGAEGSYYGKLIQSARDQNRIMSIPIIPDLPVHTGWDIGVGDSTAIWCLQVLKNGNINWIYYYENQGEGLEHYISHLNKFRDTYNIIWGKHFVPFDMENQDFSNGMQRIDVARNFGYPMHVVPKLKLDEGIQAVRSLLPLSYFDENRCKLGIRCLDMYRKKWNDIHKIYYDEPLHDRYSHGSDAARYACIGIKSGALEGGSIENDYKALKAFWG